MRGLGLRAGAERGRASGQCRGADALDEGVFTVLAESNDGFTSGGRGSGRVIADGLLVELIAGCRPLDLAGDPARLPQNLQVLGDRGLGDGEQGSDGVVPYKSAHLVGAQSEVIVPSDHAATAHPLTVLEVKRILKLHLQQAGVLSS